MNLVDRELTKLAAASVIVNEMVKAAAVQQEAEMSKQAKMNPGLIALLAALGLGGAAAGAAAGGAFDTGKTQRTSPPGDIQRTMRQAIDAVQAKAGIDPGAMSKAKQEGHNARQSSPNSPANRAATRGIARNDSRLARDASAYGQSVADSVLGRGGAAGGGNAQEAAHYTMAQLRDLFEQFGAGQPQQETNGMAGLGRIFNQATSWLPGR